MSRTFVTSRLEDGTPEMDSIRDLFEKIPEIEPANGGPNDDEFISAMELSAKSELSMPFPDPYFTAQSKYDSKR